VKSPLVLIFASGRFSLAIFEDIKMRRIFAHLMDVNTDTEIVIDHEKYYEPISFALKEMRDQQN